MLNQALARAGYAPRATGNAATLWRWVCQGEGDVVITDVVMPDENAFDLIPRIKKLRPDLPDHRHERAEHADDGALGSREGRVRISAEALRSERARERGRPRAGGARTPQGAARGRPRDRGAAAHRPLAADAGDLPLAGAADAHGPDGDDHRRVRHRQGAGGARAARLLQAPQRARSSPSTWRRSRAS